MQQSRSTTDDAERAELETAAARLVEEKRKLEGQCKELAMMVERQEKGRQKLLTEVRRHAGGMSDGREDYVLTEINQGSTRKNLDFCKSPCSEFVLDMNLPCICRSRRATPCASFKDRPCACFPVPP